MLHPAYVNLWVTTYAVKQTSFLHMLSIPTLCFGHQIVIISSIKNKIT
jgi:hypothetical protein